MAYTAKTWVTGETIEAVDLNHAEQGIATAQSGVDAISANGAIDTANLANAAVTNAKLDQEAVDSNNIRAGAIITPNLADGAVTLAKLADAVKSHFALADDVDELKIALDIRIPDWEQGGISFSTGALFESTIMIRSNSLNEKINTVSVQNQYDIGLLAWNNTTYMGAWNENRWTKGNIWAKTFNLFSIRQEYPNYTFRLVLRNADNSAITLDSSNVVTISPSSIIDDFSNEINHNLASVENALNTGYIRIDIDGGLVLGNTGNGSSIISSTGNMITQTIQSVENDCVLTTDWTKYMVYPWRLENGTWRGLGWKYSNIELEAGYTGRFVVRGLTTHDFTEAEQLEINTVTFYKKETAIGKATNNSDFISICHQGYSETMNIGENLLAGYPLAKEKGFDYGECDVKLSSDNVVMCCHDASFVDATTGDTIVIADHTAAELKTYDYYGSTIATLDEIVSACKVNGIGLVIDHATNAILPYIFPIIKKYGMQDSIIFLIGWAVGNPTYANNMYNSIVSFYKKSKVMFMAGTTSLEEVKTYLSALDTGFSRVYVTLNHSNYTVSDVINLSGSLGGNYTIAVWTIDNVATAKSYMPYVTAITSNKVSSIDIFT